MDDLYREQILEHYKYPQNYGDLPDATITQEEHNPFCGDQITLFLRVEDEIITGVSFRGRGCAISQAAASMLTETLVGQTVEAAKAIDKTVILELLGIPIGPVRIKCALLVLKALKAGLYGVPGWDDEETW